MNNHDQQRINQVKRTLTKAKEQLETVHLYLVASSNPDPVEIADMNEVEQHIDIALERLGSVVIQT